MDSILLIHNHGQSVSLHDRVLPFCMQDKHELETIFKLLQRHDTTPQYVLVSRKFQPNVA